MSETIEEIFGYAPKDATHYNQNNQMFYKFIGDAGLFWDDSHSEWLVASSRHSYPAIIERPQPKPWSGPEDGLPPVGSRVMVHECSHDYTKKFNGQTVRIVGHDRGDLAVFAAKDFIYHALVADKFKLAPTAEQIAADKRETAIRELMDIAQVDCRVTAARLVDAGFKREVV